MSKKILTLVLPRSRGWCLCSQRACPGYVSQRCRGDHPEPLPECHCPGEIAPFSLMSYKDARPWAKAIREDVLTKKMLPWFADPKYGHFADDRSLSKQEIERRRGRMAARKKAT